MPFFALINILDDPATTISGVGIGNAAHSFFRGFAGQYFNMYSRLIIDKNFLSRLIWETGILGTFLFFLIIFQLYKLTNSGYKLSLDNFDRSIFFASKFIIIIALITWVYNDLFIRAQFAYPFWFLMGYIQRIKNKSVIETVTK